VRTRTIVIVAILFENLIAPVALFVLLQHGGSQLAWLHRPSLDDISEFLVLLTSQGGVLLVVIYFSLAGMAFVRPVGVGQSGLVSRTQTRKSGRSAFCSCGWCCLR
jgi:hypothetical protein